MESIEDKANGRDSIGKPHNMNALESATHGFYWIASQQEPFEKHDKRILFDCLTRGILWKAPGMGSIGLESATQGFYWKASQQESFGKQHIGFLIESITTGIL